MSQCRLLCSKTADGSSMKHFPENLVTSGKGYFEFYNLNSARPPVRWEICKEKNWRYLKELLCGDTVNLGLGLPVSDQKLAVTHCKTFWKKNFMLLKEFCLNLDSVQVALGLILILSEQMSSASLLLLVILSSAGWCCQSVSFTFRSKSKSNNLGIAAISIICHRYLAWSFDPLLLHPPFASLLVCWRKWRNLG